VRTGRELRTLGPATDYFGFQSFDVSPDGSSIALGGWSKRPWGGAAAVRAWDTSTGEELYRFGHELDVNEVSFSPDGEHLVTASWDGTAKIVDRSGRVIRVLRERGVARPPRPARFPLSAAWFSPDGRLVAIAAFSYSGSEPDHVTIWDWRRGEVLRTFEDAHGLAFDPSGPRIAMWLGPKEVVEIRDVESGSRVVEIPVALGGSPSEWGGGSIAYSSDGSRIAVPQIDGSVRLFDADTGAQHLVLPAIGCQVSRVAFSPDGVKLASTSPCGGLRIWALDIGDLLEIAGREVPRALTDEECRQYLHAPCPQG
jgi:WD40 repeat protein